MKNLTTRRTIRQYSNREVSQELLNRLMTEASRTQTMGNLQLYSVVVTRSAEKKQQLAPAHFNQPMVTKAPVVLTVCADFNRTSVWARNRKAVPGYDNFLSFVNAGIDALLFTQTLCNLMDEEGLGYCYLGTTVYMPQMIIDTLHLPQQPRNRLFLIVCRWRVLFMTRHTRTIQLKILTLIISIRSNWLRTVIFATSTKRKRWPRYLQISDIRKRTTRRCRQGY